MCRGWCMLFIRWMSMINVLCGFLKLGWFVLGLFCSMRMVWCSVFIMLLGCVLVKLSR